MTVTEQLLPTFEPSEADMIQMALDMPLDRKIEKAILFYQTYCDGAYGAFSGGKDSCVIKQLAIDAGVSVDWHYNNVTIDPPELVRFIKKHHAEVKWNNPKMHLLTRMVEKKSIPTRLGRWCCDEYKEQGGKGCNVIVGVRVAESASRAKIWKQIVSHTKQNKTLFAPICYWTDEDVWNYIKLRNIPYCELYDEGFKRLGCVGCPLSSTENRTREFKRWPRYHDAWKRAVYKTYNEAKKDEKYRAVLKYGSAAGLWSWWLSGEGSTDQCVFDDMMEQR